MSAYIRFDAYDPAGSSYVLQDESVAPVANMPVPLQTADWGTPATWELQVSGPRGTLGKHLVGQSVVDPTVTIPIRFTGTSKDDLATRIRAFVAVVEAQRKFGGQIVRRAHGQTWKQSYQLVNANQVKLTRWGPRAEISNRAEVTYQATVAPYANGDPLDYTDNFTVDTLTLATQLSMYTVDGGAATNFTVAGGVLDAAANLTTENRYIFTGTGYTVEDMQVTLNVVAGTTITNMKAGVILKRIDAANYLEVYVTDNGANSILKIDKVVANARTALASTNLAARVTAGQEFWIRGRIAWNAVAAEYFIGSAGVQDQGAATASTSFDLQGADVTTFGKLVVGRGGMVLTPQETSFVVDSFEFLPYVYSSFPYTRSLPEMYRLRAIPGDAPALLNLRVTGGSTADTIGWFALGWRRLNAASWGLITSTAFFPWPVAAVTNINAAATSMGAAPAGIYKFPNVAVYSVTAISGNADSGAARRIWRLFRARTIYTFAIWVRSSTSTANVALRVGHSADGNVATSGNVALSTTWQRLSVSWTPTSLDNYDAHISVIRRTAGAADVWQQSAEEVYEGTVAPTWGNHAKGRAAPPPLGCYWMDDYLPGAVATADANAMFGFRKDGAAGTTGTLTMTVNLDPTLLEPDPGSKSVSIEVWWRLRIPPDTTPLLTLSLLANIGGNGFNRWTTEYADAGRLVTTTTGGALAAYRYYRVGTLQIPLGTAYTGPVTLTAIADWESASSVVVSSDHVLLLPMRSRAMTPTGVHGVGWLSGGVAFDLEKIIYPDLSAEHGDRYVSGIAAPGLAGSLLEIGPGAVELAAHARLVVPDDPTAWTDSNQSAVKINPTVHFGITPRYVVLRDV